MHMYFTCKFTTLKHPEAPSNRAEVTVLLENS